MIISGWEVSWLNRDSDSKWQLLNRMSRFSLFYPPSPVSWVKYARRDFLCCRGIYTAICFGFSSEHFLSPEQILLSGVVIFNPIICRGGGIILLTRGLWRGIEELSSLVKFASPVGCKRARRTLCIMGLRGSRANIKFITLQYPGSPRQRDQGTVSKFRLLTKWKLSVYTLNLLLSHPNNTSDQDVSNETQ